MLVKDRNHQFVLQASKMLFFFRVHFDIIHCFYSLVGRSGLLFPIICVTFEQKCLQRNTLYLCISCHYTLLNQISINTLLNLLPIWGWESPPPDCPQYVVSRKMMPPSVNWSAEQLKDRVYLVPYPAGYNKEGSGTYIAGLSDPVCSQSQLLFDGVGLWQWLMAKKTHIVKF